MVPNSTHKDAYMPASLNQVIEEDLKSCRGNNSWL